MLRLGLLLSLLGLVSLLSLPLLFNRQEPGERHVDAQMRVLLTALQSYESQYGNYPTGSEVVILKALTGANPRKMNFLVLGSWHTNTLGELLDPWGMPFRIVKASTNEVIIRSAGPNLTHGDKDDIVTSLRPPKM